MARFYSSQSYSLDNVVGYDDRRSSNRAARSFSDVRELDGSAESVHSAVYRDVASHVRAPFARRDVYSSRDIASYANGASVVDFPLILVSPNAAAMDASNPQYRAFAYHNRAKSPTPKDFLEHVLYHEYGHQLFDELHSGSVRKLAGLYGRSGDDLASAVSEGFAQWFGEEMSGLGGLTEETAQRYAKTLDVGVMKHVYASLKEDSSNFGRQYVIDNLADLVDGYLSSVGPVSLPREQAPVIVVRAQGYSGSYGDVASAYADSYALDD